MGHFRQGFFRKRYLADYRHHILPEKRAQLVFADLLISQIVEIHKIVQGIQSLRGKNYPKLFWIRSGDNPGAFVFSRHRKPSFVSLRLLPMGILTVSVSARTQQ
jgi:hypothetical protein